MLVITKVEYFETTDEDIAIWDMKPRLSFFDKSNKHVDAVVVREAIRGTRLRWLFTGYGDKND